METNNQVSQPVIQPMVDYAAALRQYQKYGRGRSMKKFCKLAREGQIEMSSKSGTDKRPGFKEQSVRKLKMNLRNAGNIGSESSAADNAFMYSVIESCRHNEIDPGKYVSYLLGKLKAARDGEDLTGPLPCYCGL